MAAALTILAGAALAQSARIPSSPQPPVDADQPFAQGIEAPQTRPAPGSGSGQPGEEKVDIPLPRPSPDAPVDPAFAEQPADTPRIATDPNEPGETVDVAVDVAVAASNESCMADLRKIAEARTTNSPSAKDAQCVIPNPVALSGTNGEFEVGFSQTLTLDCPMALSVAQFTREVVQPLARHHIGQALTEISTGPGFSCRRRNRLPTGKLSEHALGNGVDIVGFTFEDGERFSVVPASSLTAKQARFQAALRQAACGWFTTVLGPGSNAAHADHLHFDLGRTKDLKPGREPYRICE